MWNCKLWHNTAGSHHPRSDEVSHPRPDSGNLHKTLVPDAHVLCHHVRPRRKEDQKWQGHKISMVKVISRVRAEGVGEGNEDSSEGVTARRKEKDIMMRRVRVNQYQSNPVKTMSDGWAPRIANNLQQRNGIYAASAFSFRPAAFGKLSICLANLSHV